MTEKIWTVRCEGIKEKYHNELGCPGAAFYVEGKTDDDDWPNEIWNRWVNRTVFDNEQDFRKACDEALREAHLIAAAPELQKAGVIALQALQRTHLECTIPREGCLQCEAIKQQKAALAKARGE